MLHILLMVVVGVLLAIYSIGLGAALLFTAFFNLCETNKDKQFTNLLKAFIWPKYAFFPTIK